MAKRHATMVACEQALYLGLTRDLFWAQVAAGGLGRESRATARELGRERSTPPPQFSRGRSRPK